MSLPPFWLKITKQHIIDNFEDLIQYLKRYPSASPADLKNEDFVQTCRLLRSVADDYIPQINDLPLYAEPRFADISVPMLIRILAATLYTAHITGAATHTILTPLVRLILLSNKQLTPDIEHKYLEIVKSCIERRSIKFLNFTLSDIDADFAQGIFEVKLASMTFETPANDHAPAVYQNNGCLIVKDGEVTLSNVNYINSQKKKLKDELTATRYRIAVKSTGTRTRREDLATLLQLYPVITGEYKTLPEPPAPKLKKYDDSDYFLVRITDIRGIKIEGETVDPAYEKESGNIFIDNNYLLNRWLPIDYLKQVLHVGAYIPVVRNNHPTMPFRLDKEWLEEFVGEYIESQMGDLMTGIYYCDINGGTKWLTDRGIYLNIFDVYITDTTRPDYQDAIDMLLPCELRLDNCEERNDNLVVKGDFRHMQKNEMPVTNRKLFETRAFCTLFEAFLKDCAARVPEQKVDTTTQSIAEPDIRLLAALLYRLALKGNLDDSFARIEQLIMAMLLMRVPGHTVEADFIFHQLGYQKALLQFAKGESPSALALNSMDALSDIPEVAAQHRIIDILKGYREHFDHTSRLSVGGARQADLAARAEDVRRLVAASNSILDSIDISEINRIKKTICSNLGVADEYANICGETVNYGSESEFLEFKTSCVIPPSNRSTGSLLKDIEIQKWNILKPICAFLNSGSEGQILIGVNDSGVPVGLTSDCDTLFRNHIISEPTADKLRLYIKLFADQAFVTSDGRVRGTSITAGLISYQIEEYKEGGGEILRIIVKPYPWDVVKFADPDRPNGIAETYLRTSGASLPLDVDGIREAKLRKLNALNKNDLKLAQVMKAIDHKLVVKIDNYFGKEGPSTRRVEPYRILHDRKAFLAFDLDRRDMRTFKLARFKELTLTDKKWSNEALHADRSVDIFGMMQTADKTEHRVVMQLTDYAWCLLMEEYNVASRQGTPEAVRVTEDRRNPDAARFPWTVEVPVYHFAGVARFIMGLPGQIRLRSPQALTDYIAAQTLRT